MGCILTRNPSKVKAAVKAAVNAGYRLLDCAAGYGNQKEVGEAIAELISEGVVARSDLFVVSKLFQTHHVWDGDDSRCYETLDQTLADLQLDYLDLFLIHSPSGGKLLETWSAILQAKKQGLARAVGVSNFGNSCCH